MAREILIKAKVISGFWVIGFPQYTWKGEEGYVIDSIKSLEYPREDNIKPETICQFTGLHDMEKNRIFENDILRTGSGTEEDPFKDWHIYYSKIMGQYRMKKIDGPGELNPFPMNERGIVIKNMHDS